MVKRGLRGWEIFSDNHAGFLKHTSHVPLYTPPWSTWLTPHFLQVCSCVTFSRKATPTTRFYIFSNLPSQPIFLMLFTLIYFFCFFFYSTLHFLTHIIIFFSVISVISCLPSLLEYKLRKGKGLCQVCLLIIQSPWNSAWNMETQQTLVE